MTITLAHPVPTSPVTDPQLIATTRCRCGGLLAVRPVAGRDLAVHVDACVDCPTDGTACDLSDLHVTCATPTPVECLHVGCRVAIRMINSADPDGPLLRGLAVGDTRIDTTDCTTGLDACCGCCFGE